MRLTRVRLVLAIIPLMSSLWAPPARSQAIQAYRSLQTDRETIEAVVARLAADAATRLAIYDQGVSFIRALPQADTTREARAMLPVVERRQELAKDALRSVNEPVEFLRRYQTLLDYEKPVGNVDRFLRESGRPLAEARAIPALFKLPDVVFTVGATVTFGHGQATLGQGEINSNLLGAAAGAAFGAIGSSDIKDYFLDNLAVGTAFPVGGTHKLAAAVGVGLGQMKIGRYTLWPAINIEQVDSGDSRVPRDIVAKSPTSANWSSPLLAIAISGWDLTAIRDKMAQGSVKPIFTVGVRLPYYYPNEPFSAVAALFSDKRRDYEQSGKVRFQVGVFFPLQKLKPLTPQPAP